MNIRSKKIERRKKEAMDKLMYKRRNNFAKPMPSHSPTLTNHTRHVSRQEFRKRLKELKRDAQARKPKS